ncbi:tail fiber assembly protein [Escherichia coli]|uniref:tail fiber assembly protein n=1 Tax=Escherichia coli TaxID=562 RepID=UPI0020000DF5|nr:tail fiber assembly protein [Escherichia coli]MCK2420152.1 tail fiber assembly protein [Escherichia coli]MEC4350261.1 tail fiber assembly protein [Escherichia coli]
MRKTYAVIENNTVVNVVLWDGESEWSPDNGVAIPAADGVGIGWLYADGAFTAPDIPEPVKSHAELVAQAEAEKRARIDAATSRIVVWQTKLLMGRKLTDGESASLNAWIDYIDAVTAIDTSTAPDISWPELPI